MKRAPIPPKTLVLSLPALSRGQAEQLLHLVDALQQALWDAYADDVFELAADRASPQPDSDALGPDDFPDF
jgi:hypothetical protein